MKRRFLLFIVFLGLGLCGYFYFTNRKLQWKLLTPIASSWSLESKTGKIFIADEEKKYFVAETSFDLSITPSFDRACFMAPSNMNFRLEVNGHALISKDQFTTWPNSFSEEQLRIAPFYDVQPNVLEPKKLLSILKEGTNAVRIFLYARDTFLLQMPHFGLAIHTSERNSKWTQFNIAKGEEVKENGIPVIRISVPQYTITPDKKVDGKMSVSNESVEEKFNIKIESRGKTSLGAEKKSYSISLKGNEKSLCGMPEGKDWILYGGWYDLSLIRNMLAFELGRKQNHYEPQTRFVELVINNNYRGVYVLMEKPQLSSTRLHADGKSSTEDFLIMADRVDSNDVLLKTIYWSYILKSKSELADSLYQSLVIEQMNCFEGNVFYGERAPCFDVQSFVDYLLVQELSVNRDAYRLSAFFHAFGSGNDTLVKAGPLWDFDLAFHPLHDTTTWILNRKKEMPAYWHQLFEYQPFYESCCARYAELRKTLWNDASLESMIDSLASIAINAGDRNYHTFPFPASAFWPYEVLPKNYDDEIAMLKLNIRKRTLWMDERLTGIAD